MRTRVPFHDAMSVSKNPSFANSQRPQNTARGTMTTTSVTTLATTATTTTTTATTEEQLNALLQPCSRIVDRWRALAPPPRARLAFGGQRGQRGQHLQHLQLMRQLRREPFTDNARDRHDEGRFGRRQEVHYVYHDSDDDDDDDEEEDESARRCLLVLKNEKYSEAQLLPGVSPQDILAIPGVTLAGFCKRFRGTAVWMSSEEGESVDAFLFVHTASDVEVPTDMKRKISVTCSSVNDNDDDDDCDSTVIISLYEGLAASGLPLSTGPTLDMLFSLFARSSETSTVIDVECKGACAPHMVPVSTDALNQVLAMDSLTCVTLNKLILTQDNIRSLQTVSRADLELKLQSCKLSRSQVCRAMFVECLHQDLGPTELDLCSFHSYVLAAAIIGNSRVTRIACRRFPDNDCMRVFVQALEQNEGLVELDMNANLITMENWKTMCHSLRKHPAMVNLILIASGSGWEPGGGSLTEAKTVRTRHLVDMMRDNTKMQTVDISTYERDEEVYTNEVVPCLETNVFRIRIAAMKRVRPESRRRMILGRTMEWSHNVNILWCLLSGNVDVAFFSAGEQQQQQGAAAAAPANPEGVAP